MNLRQTWKELTNMYSLDNEIGGEILFHILIGQYFKNVKIGFYAEEKDVRVSALWCQPTRTGKGQAMKVLKKACTELGITWKKATQITDAGLIGSVNREIDMYNIKHNLQPGNNRYLNPIEEGDLARYDIIIFDEARKLLKPGPWTEDMLSIFQESLDYPGLVRKKLSSRHEIEFVSTSSIIGTTYFIKQIKEVLLYQGFFQRILLYIRKIDYKQRQSMRQKVIDGYLSDNKIERGENLLKEFCSSLKKIDNSPREITATKEAIEVINSYITQFEDFIIENFKDKELEILGSFVYGLQDLFIKLASHYCLIDEKSKINKNHVIMAKRLVNICMKSLMHELLPEIDEREKGRKELWIKRISAIIKDKEMNKEDIVEVLRKTWNVGRNKSLSFINKGISNNHFIEIKKERNNKIIKLKEETK